MSEASFWDYLRSLLPREGHYSRIESKTSAGFPDVHYTLDGVSGTLELKDAKRPTAKYPFSGKSGLRKSQLLWIREEIEAGGTVILALQCGKEVFLLKADCYYEDLSRMTKEEIGKVAKLLWGKGDRETRAIQAVLGSLLIDE